MKKTVLTVVTFLTAIITNAQNPPFEWVQKVGGPQYERAFAMAFDGSGNIYTTGYFRGTLDFDPGAGTFNLTSSGSGDNAFILKMDTRGNFVWAKNIGATVDIKGTSIAVGESNNIYITGMFSGTTDLNPGTGVFNISSVSTGGGDVCIVKLDNNGNFIWGKNFGGSGSVSNSLIAVDAGDNVHVSGLLSGTADFNPGAGTSNLTAAIGGEDIFITKLDSAGNFIWVKQLGGAGRDFVFALSLDKANNIYTTGMFDKTADFNPDTAHNNLTAKGGFDIFVSKLNVNGQFVWAALMGGPNNEQGYSVTTDASGNVYTVGSYIGSSVDFDPGAGVSTLANSGGQDMFLSKLDSSGKFVWVKRNGSSGEDVAHTVTIDETDNIYFGGSFNGTVDFDPGAGTTNLISNGSYDMFVSKYDKSGNFMWARSMGGTAVDEVKSVKLDPAGNIYSMGYFQNTVDFDPYAGTTNLTCAGVIDFFVHKMSECHSFEVKTVLTGSSIKAVQTGPTYQWIDCNNGNKPIAGETKQTFDAKAIGSYAVIVSMGVCKDTSACVNVTTVNLVDHLLNNRFTLSPNPTNGIFNIIVPGETEKVIIEVFSSLGVLVYRQHAGEMNAIDLSGAANGLYIVKVTDENNRVTSQKIIKQ